MKLSTLRAALIAGVNAVFDVLEHAEAEPRRRAPMRPPAMPENVPSELDRAAARAELNRIGVPVKR